MPDGGKAILGRPVGHDGVTSTYRTFADAGAGPAWAMVARVATPSDSLGLISGHALVRQQSLSCCSLSALCLGMVAVAASIATTELE